MPPNAKLMSWRAELRKKILDELQRRDPSAPDTLEFAVAAMLEMHFLPREISVVVGPSQTTISRWGAGQTIPRSTPYRKWVVETLTEHLRRMEIPNADAGN